ncbi:Transcriptional adapter ada2 [Nowakowskiella sp. JEL0078]|nr:Transcriptional adapter ada2 [Nowakowskiella sp. JEL0078]
MTDITTPEFESSNDCSNKPDHIAHNKQSCIVQDIDPQHHPVIVSEISDLKETQMWPIFTEQVSKIRKASPTRPSKQDPSRTLVLDVYSDYVKNPFVYYQLTSEERARIFLEKSNRLKFEKTSIHKIRRTPLVGTIALTRRAPPMNVQLRASNSSFDYMYATSKKYSDTSSARKIVFDEIGPLEVDHNAEGYFLLTKEEIQLCKTMRLIPLVYLHIKETLLKTAVHRGWFRKRDAQEMFRMNVNRLSKIYDWFRDLKWIPDPKPSKNEGQP